MFLPGGRGVNPTPRIWAVCRGLSPRCCGIDVGDGLLHFSGMAPELATDPALWPLIFALLHEALPAMEGRTGTPVACMFLTPKPGALYVGKLAVAASHRGQGLARRMLDRAEARARDLGLPALELQTRVELVENQAAFLAMGFVEVGRTAHKGYDRPTSITYRRAVF